MALFKVGSVILLLVCLFSICLKAQTEFRVYQKESKKGWYYISAPINGTKLNDILITTGDAGFYIKEHDFNELFPDHSFAKLIILFEMTKGIG